MPINLYNKIFNEYFKSEAYIQSNDSSVLLLKQAKRIFFVGNGGSNAICSHMSEDYAKMGGFQTFTFSDAALITCFANDYGYERAMEEWLKIYMQKDDVLIAVSSSGNSPNIINSTLYAKSIGGQVISLSGFKVDNKLYQLGDVNFHIACENYGVVECFHQVILHVILDTITEK